MSVRVYEVPSALWVVANDGGWLPGVYNSEAAARLAAALAARSYFTLATVWHYVCQSPLTEQDMRAATLREEEV